VNQATTAPREPRALAGRRIVVTRPRAQADGLAALLEAQGAEVRVLSTIRLQPPDDWGPLDAAIARLGTFGWVVFTSANGVAAFRDRLSRVGLDPEGLAGARLAAVGPGTAEALRTAGLRADVVPAEFRAEGLVEALSQEVGPGVEVLVVRAAEARDVLPRELEARGARVTVAPAYRTVPATEGAGALDGWLRARQIDAVTFTSSSTVRGFVNLLAPGEVRQLLAGVALAAIGPVTAGTLAEYGLAIDIMPREYTVPALAAAIAGHFGRRT
jgi:uroporphyrinogen III methyltransferase / synthase